MVDSSPGLLGQGIRLDAAVHQGDGLRRAGERAEDSALEQPFLGRLERLVRLDRFLKGLAELVGEPGGIGGEALGHPVHRGIAGELGLKRVFFEMDEEL